MSAEEIEATTCRSEKPATVRIRGHEFEIGPNSTAMLAIALYALDDERVNAVFRAFNLSIMCVDGERVTFEERAPTEDAP